MAAMKSVTSMAYDSNIRALHLGTYSTRKLASHCTAIFYPNRWPQHLCLKHDWPKCAKQCFCSNKLCVKRKQKWKKARNLVIYSQSWRTPITFGNLIGRNNQEFWREDHCTFNSVLYYLFSTCSSYSLNSGGRKGLIKVIGLTVIAVIGERFTAFL